MNDETETMTNPRPSNATMYLLILDKLCPHGLLRFAAPPTLITNQVNVNTHIRTIVATDGFIYPSVDER